MYNIKSKGSFVSSLGLNIGNRAIVYLTASTLVGYSMPNPLYVYIYIYICVCVCVCARVFVIKNCK